MTKNIRVSAAALALGLFLLSPAYSNETRWTYPLTTRTIAEEAMLRWSGMSRIRSEKQLQLATTSELLPLSADSALAFTKLQDQHRSLWLASVRHATIPAPGILGRKGQAVTLDKHVKMSLDSASGHILSFSVTTPEFVPVFDLPVARDIEKLLLTCSFEIIGRAETPPAVDLLYAIEKCEGYALLSGQIVGTYVQCVRTYPQSVDTMPTWLLFMRSSPLLPIDDRVSRGDRTHMIALVDAMTGARLLLVNAPLLPSVGPAGGEN